MILGDGHCATKQWWPSIEGIQIDIVSYSSARGGSLDAQVSEKIEIPSSRRTLFKNVSPLNATKLTQSSAPRPI